MCQRLWFAKLDFATKIGKFANELSLLLLLLLSPSFFFLVMPSSVYLEPHKVRNILPCAVRPVLPA